VVLLDIWTYSCINCQRTLPYLKDWYAKYHSQGLEIVGLHTPEFAFEHVLANVEQAVKDFGLTYPVVLDNDYSTWRALGNQFWPRKYLIDTEGNIIYDHIGEGGYAEMEAAIQAALKARATKLGLSTTLPTTGSVPTDAVSVGPVSSPETYFGAGRGHAILELPDTPEPNQLYLGGQWSLQPEYAENTAADATILFAYQAKNVYMAAGAPTGVTVEIYQDDKLVKKLKIKDEITRLKTTTRH
jgi:thiol-disulfide isomerase/thioredoxin